MTARGAQVREAIEQRFGVCAVLPVGTITELAAEFGVTRQRVSQIVIKLGKSGTTRTPKKVCASCGKRMTQEAKAIICRECGWIDVACSSCGKLVRRSATMLASRVGVTNIIKGEAATYTGQTFCNRTCFGKMMGKKNLRPIQHGTRHAYRGRGCRCAICVTDGVAAEREAAREAYRRKREKMPT